MTRREALAGLGGAFASALPAQVIEFENNGLRYQTLTRNGITVMFAHMPVTVREFSILQVAVANGTRAPYSIRPEDFRYYRAEDSAVQATPARDVVQVLIDKGGRNDVIRLVSAYEGALYGMQKLRPTNGYEQRRQSYLAETSTKLKAAAAASAIAFVATKLGAGQSTDGAVFFPTFGKPLQGGRLVVRTNSDLFEFNRDASTSQP